MKKVAITFVRSGIMYTFAHPKNGGHAKLAQLVEHFIRNERVAGSSPAFGSLPN